MTTIGRHSEKLKLKIAGYSAGIERGLVILLGWNVGGAFFFLPFHSIRPNLIIDTTTFLRKGVEPVSGFH